MFCTRFVSQQLVPIESNVNNNVNVQEEEMPSLCNDNDESAGDSLSRELEEQIDQLKNSLEISCPIDDEVCVSCDGTPIEANLNSVPVCLPLQDQAAMIDMIDHDAQLAAALQIEVNDTNMYPALTDCSI